MPERIPKQYIEKKAPLSEAETLQRERAPLSAMSAETLLRKLGDSNDGVIDEADTVKRSIDVGSDNTHIYTIKKDQKFENAKRLHEELGREITPDEIIQNIPEDFDTTVFSEKTRAYLKNAYPHTQFWDPRLIMGLDECGIHMDPERTIKPRILVTQIIKGEKTCSSLDIPEAVRILLAYAKK